MAQLTFIDFFAGIGGFRRGMELAGHKCVGFCEFDSYAVASYTMMHLATEKQLQHIDNLSKQGSKTKALQREVLKEAYRNGEWYANDVRRIDAGLMPRADCWCFGFPCQDISISGERIGFNGQRSSLFFAVTRLIRELGEKDRPSYLFIENVQNLLSVNRGFDFAKLLIELDEIGYDAQWQVINSADFGIPHERKRLFIVGYRRTSRNSEFQILPLPKASKKNHLRKIAGSRQRERIYAPSGTCSTLCSSQGGGGGNTGLYAFPIFCDLTQGDFRVTERVRCLQARYFKGVTNRKTECSGVLEQSNEALKKYAVWSEKCGCYIVVRRLTPKECFRVQGWSDEDYRRAALVNSESQLYKQVGNGVTVNVIEAIAKRM